MVEDANAPPSPQPEESAEKAEGEEGGEAAVDSTPLQTPGRGRGRGRGGRGRGSTRSTPAKPQQTVCFNCAYRNVGFFLLNMTVIVSDSPFT